LKREDFRKLVKEAIDKLPLEFVSRIENSEIIVEDAPSAEVLNERKTDSSHLLLGLYKGVPLKNRGSGYANVLPDTIIIYQKSIEAISRTETEIKQNIQSVLEHEIGHHFGLEEDELS
jgi:predicted Zn-dependent protease with MMP-like domain